MTIPSSIVLADEYWSTVSGAWTTGSAIAMSRSRIPMSIASSPEHMVGRSRTLMSFFLGSDSPHAAGRYL
jgi:hypothetical protein